MRTYLSGLQLELCEYLRQHPGATVPGIQKEFGFKSKMSVYWHIGRLEKAGIITRPRLVRTEWQVKKPDVKEK